MGADVLETLAPPPEGDNDLKQARTLLDPSICTKGNLSLMLLRDGSPDEIGAQTRILVESVRGSAHVVSTADAVLVGTPPENFIASVATARQLCR